MTIVINATAPELPTGLAEAVSQVDFPTLGHFLEQGFCDPQIMRQAGESRLVGRAITVRITATDSTLVHKATSLLTAGDVLVVDTGGDRIHAPVGGVVARAIAASGATGVVIDGVCTDLAMLRESGLAVYARGSSVLTTKLLGIDSGAINVPIGCGGVPVLPGQLVLGDENGLLIAAPEQVEGALASARKSDADEPTLLEQIDAGKKLPELTQANALLERLGHT